MTQRVLAATLVALTAFSASFSTSAQTAPAAHEWPDRPIRMIVPFPPGGGTDILARIVGNKLGESAKWTVVIDNRAGAGGTIGLAEAAKSASGGYDIVMGQKDNVAVGPWLYKNLGYDPINDLIPVAHVAYTPIVFVTSKNSKFKTFADVIAAAKRAPDTITYGSPGNGTTIHLAGEMVGNAAGIKLRHIPYKGSSPAMVDAIAGVTDLMVSSVPSAMAQIKSGAVRALAVSSAKRSSSLPDVPTVAELGYPDVDVSTWYGVFMPANAPKTAVTKMNVEVNKLLATKAMRDAILDQGAEPLALSTDAFSALVKTDVQRYKDIVLKAGVKLE